MTDITTLVAALGGDSKVTAIYDTRYQVTQGAGVVTAWDDARGPAGYGPQLVAAGSPTPAWDGTNFLITTDGSQNYFSTAASTAFDVSLGRTFIYIGSLPSGNYPVVLGDSGITKYVTLNTQLSNIREVSASTGQLSFPTAASATRRLAVISLSQANFYGASIPTLPQMIGMIQGRVGTNAQYYQPGGAQTSGSWKLWLGNYASQFTGMVMRAVLVLDHPVTGDDLATIRDWSTTNHAHVADSSVTRMIMFDGNSLTAGTGASAGNDYPTQVMASTGFTSNFDWIQNGTGSRFGSTQLAAFPSRAAPAFQGGQTKKVYVCWEITNDLVNGVSAAQAVSNVQQMCQAAKAAGALTVALTCLPRVDLSGATETARLAANVLLRALPSGIDRVADVAAIVNLQTPSNGTYFYTDQIHLTAAGYTEVALNATNGVAPTVTALINATFALPGVGALSVTGFAPTASVSSGLVLSLPPRSATFSASRTTATFDSPRTATFP